MTLELDLAPALGGAQRVAVLVAHPDDEVLWAGGLLLSQAPGPLFIATLCRGQDPDRAPRFQQALGVFSAQGAMGDLDDGPEQAPLPEALVQSTLLSLLPHCSFDLVLTHAPEGEYTSHRRHQEVARAVRTLVDQGALGTTRFWQFAYDDQNGQRLPQARPGASLTLPLEPALWARKYQMMTQLYGFGPASWEARSTPRTEAFTCYRTSKG